MDTYLYGESNRSTIPTFRALAILSKLSRVGEYFSIIILLIVDFGIPVMFDSCRTDTFFSYMICVSNIFIGLLFTKIIVLCRCYFSNMWKENFMKKKSILLGIAVFLLCLLSAFPVCASEECSHVWSEWIVDQKPTIFEEGISIQYCINCFDENVKEIPKLKMTPSQKQVKKSVDHFFKYAKQYNTGKLAKCFTKPSSVKLFVENNYMASYFKKYNKRISYELKSIKVSGKTATVKLSYKYPDRYSVFMAAFENAVYYQIENPNASEAQLMKYLYERICKHSKVGIDYNYGKLTLKLKKSGSSWKIASFSSKINNLIHSNYTKAYNDYF